MYLSKVEMTGFKSFADKTTIEFDQGLTAVVGPNGSGKSNLSEAVRWVLGEQSAKSLRGNRMEDVIFNGTQDRKPVNIAKVTLVLNNEDRYLDYDFSEISISRSYNRNGDSSYTINNERVRLKDIVDLFLDSGLGKNSFSIISQGQVEQIFLNKPEERRSIFEEAAGVQKYQYRKIEAERKLDKTKDNLSRVRDIIHEIEGQLSPLVKQREAALIYQEKEAKLKELEVSLYTDQISEYRQQWHDLEEEVGQQKQTIQQMDDQLNKLQGQIQRDKEEQSCLIDQVDQLSNQRSDKLQVIERLKGQQQILLREIEYNQSSQGDRQVQYDKQKEELRVLQAKLVDLSQTNSELDESILKFHEEFEEAKQERLKYQDLKAEDVEELRNELMSLYQGEAQTNNEIRQHKSQILRSQEQVHRLNEVIEERQQEEEVINKQINDLDQELSQLDKKWQTHEDQIQQFRQEYVQLLHEEKLLQKELFNQERQVQKYQAQYQSLQQMQASYAGYYAGVRSVMQEEFPGVHGPIADLIQVEELYAKAIDTALASSLQHIVVDNDLVAKRAIDYLKKGRHGRATFLPLTNIKGREMAGNILKQLSQQDGFIDLGINLVSFQDQYRPIISNLLELTLVVEELEQAQKIAQLLKYKFKVVTLDGEILLPGGSVSGGRQKQESSSVLSRQSEIEEISQLFKEAKFHLADLESAIVDKQELAKEIQNKGQDLQKVLSQLQEEKQDLSQEIARLKAEKQQIKNFLIINSIDLKEANENLDLSQTALSSFQTALKKLQVNIQLKSDQLNQDSLNQEEKQEQRQKLDQKVHQLETQIAVAKVEGKQIKEQIKINQEQQASLLTALEQFESNQNQHQLDLDKMEDSFQIIGQEIIQNEEEAHKLQVSIEKQRQKRLDLADQISLLEEEDKKLNLELSNLRQQISKAEARIERNQSLIDNYLNHLNQEYQLTFEMAEEIAKPVKSRQNLSQIVKKIRQDIQKLGPVNLQSISDFDQLNERYELLTEQESDLLEAMDQLLKTIKEMDREVIQRFGTTFQEINEQFKKTFTKLFGGGQAYLSLTEPDDLLTSGIDIIAQPPGKKKQNLALLSGGERALTAIALLFAILEVKPVPFVILDEVEAALDDANVYRYGSYIQSFTQDTQFIVITHRKGTMEQADRLYGVTMEKSGVSKLASVKLSEA